VIFFVRHGESIWNEAQSAKDFGQMVSDVDHGLSIDGMAQVGR
jgi:hypothetical protein